MTTDRSELWLVVDKDGDCPKVCVSKNHAEAYSVLKSMEYPLLAPWTVLHYKLAEA